MIRGLQKFLSIPLRKATVLLSIFTCCAFSATAQCPASQPTQLFPGCGNTEIRADDNIAGVQYVLISATTGRRVGGNTGQGNGGSVSVAFATVTDQYFIRAKKPGCPDSIDFGLQTITVEQPPTTQTLYGGGYYCSDNGPVEIGLNLSEAGVHYDLSWEGNIVASINGTGGPVSFGYFSSIGSYSAAATRNACQGQVVGEVSITNYKSLPFFEGFNPPGDQYTNCWYPIFDGIGAAIHFQTSSSAPTTTPFEGSRFVFWNSASYPTGTRTSLVAPPVSTGGNANLEVEFYWYNENVAAFAAKNDGVQVKFSFDGFNWNNAGSFVTRHDNSLPTNTSQWKKKTITLPAATANQPLLYVAFEFYSDAGRNCAMDAISFRLSPGCVQPSGITASAVTTTTANISFTGTGNFILEYGLQGFSPGTGTSLAGSPPFNLIGLNSGSRYDVYVRKDCGNGVYSLTAPVYTFTTSCNTVTSFPYIESFETSPLTPFIPACWTTINTVSLVNYWRTTTESSRTGTSGMEGGAVSGSPNNPFADAYLVSPKIHLTGGQRLRYWVRLSYDLSPFMYEVRISTNGNAQTDFQTRLLKDTLTSLQYEERIIDLSGISGDVYIAFRITPDQADITTANFDDFTIENIPLCPQPALPKIISKPDGAIVSWTGQGTYIIEYGAANFTPGTGSSPGVGGTILNSSTGTATISGLAASTNYDVYIRRNCTSSANGFSSNTKISFRTFISCSPSNAITLCTNVTANIGSGIGAYDFFGIYPINSSGRAMKGRELIYNFTAPTSGVYYIETPPFSSDATFFYKPASEPCSNKGWTSIGDANGFPFKNAIGFLQQGVQYLILIDHVSTNAISQIFKICKATVANPTTLNECTETILRNKITANNPKREYFIDDNGSLVAEMDFTNVPYFIGNVNLQRSINTGPIRRDDRNKEFLDRNITINAYVKAEGLYKIRIFVPDNEITRLINEPDDGIADVNNINNLVISRLPQPCSNELSERYFGNELVIFQTANGNFEPGISYIEFISPMVGSFFFHGFGDFLPLKKDAIVCPGGSITFQANEFPGSLVEFQVDDGSGFIDIENNNIYNVSGPTLDINNPPPTFGGYKYRCKITSGTMITYTESRILKFGTGWNGNSSGIWNDPSNWDCGVVPNEFTDVVIPAGVLNMPIVTANTSVKSLTIRPGASITINSGFKLEVKGK